MAFTKWLLATSPDGTTNGPSGILSYSEQSHESALKDWVGRPVDVNHILKDGRTKPIIGEVQDSKVVNGWLWLQVSIDDEKHEKLINQDLHNGWSMGVVTKDSVPDESGETDGLVVEYVPHHLSLILSPEEPRCPKDMCDLVQPLSDEQGSGEQFAFFQVGNKQVVMADDLEGVYYETGRLETGFEEHGEEVLGHECGRCSPDSQEHEDLESAQEFESFEECVIQFKSGGRTKEEAIRACSKIFEGKEISRNFEKEQNPETGDFESCVTAQMQNGVPLMEALGTCSVKFDNISFEQESVEPGVEEEQEDTGAKHGGCPPGQTWSEERGECVDIAEQTGDVPIWETGDLDRFANTFPEELQLILNNPKLARAVTQKEKNLMPDSSFLLVKDDVTDKSLHRALPFKSRDGNISCQHLLFALQRLEQVTGFTEEEIEAARNKANRLLEKSCDIDLQSASVDETEIFDDLTDWDSVIENDSNDKPQLKFGDEKMTDKCDCKDNIAEELAQVRTELASRDEVISKLRDEVDELKLETAARQEALEEARSENEQLQEVVTAYQENEKESLLEQMPDVEGVDYASMSVERLKELATFYDGIKVETAGAKPAAETGDEEDPVEVSAVRARLAGLKKGE